MGYEDLSIEHYNDVVRMFHSESDRGAAVLAGSYVENCLASYLRSKMIADDDVQNLFSGFGPLADFYGRIECAYAFGFISARGRSDLNYIRKVRNHFAHHPKEASFKTDPVKSWVAKLSTPTELNADDGTTIRIEEGRDRFLLTISQFVGWAWMAIQERK